MRRAEISPGPDFLDKPATVSHWLDGTRQPTIGNLRAAVNALGFELALKRRK